MSLRRRFKRWFYGSCPLVRGSFPYFGFRIYFPPGSSCFAAACDQGIFEPHVVRILQQLCRSDTYMFDVGANIGLMAAAVLRQVSSSTVVCFEPSANSVPYLRRTVEASGCRDRWILVERALSSRVGQLDFAIGNPRDAMYEGTGSARRIEGARLVKVPSSTLDFEWRRLGSPPVSVIKVDVEGGEAAVLEGGSEMLGACRPHVVIEWFSKYLQECGGSPEELIGFAKRSRYEVFSIPSGIHVGNERELAIQMLLTSNFLLAPA